MSRFEDSGEESPISTELWWAISERSINCPRGQAFLREFEQILLKMPKKRLISGTVVENGEVCAIGAYAREHSPDKFADFEKRWGGAVPDAISLEETADLGKACGIARTLAWCIGYHNDETFDTCSPEERHAKMLVWVRSKITVVA